MRFVRVILAFVLLASFGFSKVDLEFDKYVYLGDNSFIFDVKKGGILDSQIGQITHKPIIVCDHNLTGFIEYTSKTRLTFFYNKPIIKGEKYICKTNSKYVNKTTKKVLYSDGFHAKIVHFAAPNVVHIAFKDEVSKEELKKHVSLEKVTKLAKSKLSYNIERSDGRNFLLRTNEDVTKIIIHVGKNLRSIHGKKIESSWHPMLDDTGIDYKTNKDTKSLIFYDNPVSAVGKKGKIVLRVFTKQYLGNDANVRKFIKIRGLKNFSVSDCEWVNYQMRKKYRLKNDSWYYFDVVGDFMPNAKYEVKFLKGFGNIYAQFFEDKRYIVKMGDYGQYVGFENSDKPYISSAGEIAIESVNVNKIQIIIDKMMNQNLRYFLNFNNDMSLNRASKEVVSKNFTIGGEKNAYTKHKIKLKEALKGLKSGIYNITIHYGKDKFAQKKVYLSDIGVGAKVYNDGIFVWSSSLKDTLSIKDAKVEVFSDKNMLIASGMTNEDGVFEYNQKDFLKQNPKSIIITKGDEQNFLILNHSIGKTNLYNIANSKNSYKVFTYFQSKLVRPDESVRALVVFKDMDYKSLKNAPIKVVMKNPLGKTIYKKAFKTDSNGAFKLEHSLQGQMTGRYSFLVYYMDKIKANESFLVEAFLPQKVKNEIILPKSDIKTDSVFEVKGKSEYLFGSPASFMKGSFKLKATSKEYKNKKYKDFTFINELIKKKNNINYINTKKRVVLDKDGSATAVLSTKITQTPPSILNGQVEFTVLDDGRAVSSYKNVDIFPYKSMVGLKLEKSIIDTDTPVQIDTVLIDPLNAKPREKTKLDVYVYEMKWYYTYDINGFFKWHQEKERLRHFTVNSSEKIQKLFTKSGDYVVEVQDSLSLHSSTVSFSVRGWDYASLSPTNKISKNQVKFEDKLYKKGDVVKLDIKSPMKKGKMLVSLENEKVLWYKLVEFENAHVKVDVPLKEDMKNGLYIHTIAVRSSDTSSSVIPFRSSSSSFIKADRTSHKLQPKIEAVKTTKSNTIIPIKVKATPNSSLLISVVDDGILQILGQKPPRPFNFFNQKPRKKIANFDMYDMLLNYLTKGKKLDFGSGAAYLAKSKKHISPDTKAKRVKPFVYFSRIIKVPESGVVKESLKVPSSYNGSATIVAIEIAKKKIGASSQKLVVKDDIIIKPIYPRYANVGDKWNIPIRVFNTTDKHLHLNLKTISKHVDVSGFKKDISLKPHSSKLLNAFLHVKTFGKGEVKIVAKTKDKTFLNQVEFPIIFAYPLSTYNKQGESKTTFTIKAPDIYMQGLTPTFRLSISGDVLAKLRSQNGYLVSYPYGCAEQTSSKMLALLNLPNFLNTQNKEELKAKLNDRKRFIKSGIDKLANLQKRDGSFGYWDINGYVNTYASIYASDVLYELKNNKIKIPTHVLEGMKKSLKNFSTLQDSENRYNRVYASYLLALQGCVDASNVNYMYDKKLYQVNLPSLYMMAYILERARMDSEKNAVLKLAYNYDFSKYDRKKRDHSGYFYSFYKDIAHALYLHVKHFKKNKASSKLYDMLKSDFKKLYSTQDKAFAIRAISEYFKGYKKGKNEFVITGAGVDELYDYEANLQGKYKKNLIKITPKQNWVNYDFSVMQYLPKPIKHESLKKSKKDLSIYRTFVDEKGKKVDLSHLKLGDLIYSKVSILSKKSIQNVVVNEQVPSCFEIVNERLNKTNRPKHLQNSKNFRPDFVDIRDDKALTFLSLNKNKTVSFFTPLRVTTKGECLLPAVFSEAMYDERISDYDLSEKTVIVK